MKSKVRNVGEIVVFDLHGKITIGAGDIQLRQLVEDTLAGGKNKIVVNLKDVSHIESSGIGEMVGCYTTVARRGGKMKLLNLPPKINDILTVTQLITVFVIYDSESDAVSSFTSS